MTYARGHRLRWPCFHGEQSAFPQGDEARNLTEAAGGARARQKAALERMSDAWRLGRGHVSGREHRRRACSPSAPQPLADRQTHALQQLLAVRR